MMLVSDQTNECWRVARPGALVLIGGGILEKQSRISSPHFGGLNARLVPPWLAQRPFSVGNRR